MQLRHRLRRLRRPHADFFAAFRADAAGLAVAAAGALSISATPKPVAAAAAYSLAAAAAATLASAALAAAAALPRRVRGAQEQQGVWARAGLG